MKRNQWTMFIFFCHDDEIDEVNVGKKSESFE